MTEKDHVETWKRIAQLAGKSERWCRYMSVRPDNPLPVFRIGKMVRMTLADYQRWIASHNPHALAETAP